MYHRRFDYMRFAKAPPPGLSLGSSGAPVRDLSALAAQADFKDPRFAIHLGEAIAARHGVHPDQVVLCVGASQANALVALAFLRSGDEVLVETPSYEALPGLASWLGAKVVPIRRSPESDWALDVDALARAITEKTRLVMLTHPHNPSGRPFSAAELVKLSGLPVPVLVDEVYRDDLLDPPPIAASANVLTTSSLTKVYGLGPLRIGWVIASSEIAAKLDEIQDWLHVVMPAPSMAMALAAWPHLDEWRLQERTAIADSRRIFDAWRARTGLLPGRIFDGMPFYCAELPDKDDRVFCESLARAGVVAPAGSFFEAPGSARIGFGRIAAAELEEALATIEKLGLRTHEATSD